MYLVTSKLKEVLFSVLPITLIVVLLHFTVAPIAPLLMARFLIGALFVIVGLSVFLIGVDLGITPIGHHMGAGITKSNKVWVVIVSGLVLGFFISIAEPDLHILADQVAAVTSGLISKWSIVIMVSIGIGVLITAGLLRIVYAVPLYKMLTVLYIIVFALALFASPEYLAIAFDASGATTGAMTVPFILALAVGVSSMEKDSKGSEKDSFGLVAIASAGAILAVLLMGIVRGKGAIVGQVAAYAEGSNRVLWPFIESMGHISIEIFVALLPIVVLYLLYQIFFLKAPKRAMRRILVGTLFSFAGLVIFLCGVNNGFMDVGRVLGRSIASFESKVPLIAIGFVLGFVTILAEPAVHVLTHQIEDVTSGYVKRSIVLVSLSIGVGVAVALSMVRILTPSIKLWHYLLPGYIISVALMYVVPKLFIGMAFDSGGVASGPMTATFILAFSQGAADASEGANVMVDGFGMIAMVALTPLIALQLMGWIYKLNSGKRGIDS